jgi:hypothetical protein
MEKQRQRNQKIVEIFLNCLYVYKRRFIEQSKAKNKRGALVFCFNHLIDAMVILDTPKQSPSEVRYDYVKELKFFTMDQLIPYRNQLSESKEEVKHLQSFVDNYDLNEGFVAILVIQEIDFFCAVLMDLKEVKYCNIDPIILQPSIEKRLDQNRRFNKVVPTEIKTWLQGMEVDPNYKPDLTGLLEFIHKPTVCYSCKKDHYPKRLKRCTACKFESYCDQKCQRAAWRDHKKICPFLKETLLILQRDY